MIKLLKKLAFWFLEKDLLTIGDQKQKADIYDINQILRSTFGKRYRRRFWRHYQHYTGIKVPFV